MTAFGALLRGLAHVPPAVWRPVARVVSAAVALHPTRGVRAWQRNAEVLTGVRPDRRLTAAAVESWAHNVVLSAQLHTWPREDFLTRVRVDPDQRERLLAAHARGGAVIGLPHMGSWDLAGAWACASGMPVSTVAEEIAEFDWFVAQREALGFRVHGHRDPRGLAKLLADQRDGWLTCLVTDRSFGPGIGVTWHTATGERTVTMPAGAATIARRTGATLFGCATTFEGNGIHLVLSDPIRVPEALGNTEAVAAMSQQLADFFCSQARATPQDWHLLLPFFDADRER